MRDQCKQSVMAHCESKMVAMLARQRSQLIGPDEISNISCYFTYMHKSVLVA